VSTSPKLLIRALVSSAATNPDLINELITARDAAVLALLTPGGGNSLSSSNKNGVSYTVLVNLSEDMRITVLDQAIYYIQSGSNVSSTSIGVFNS